MTPAAIALAAILAFSLVVVALLLSLKFGQGVGPERTPPSFVARALAFWVASTALFGGYFYTVRVAGIVDLTVERLCCLVLLAAMAGMAYRGRVAQGLDRSVDLLLFAFLGLCLISMAIHGFLAARPGLAKPWFLFMEGYLLPFLAFFCVKYFLAGEDDDRCLMRGLYILGSVIVVIALMEGFGLRDYVFLRYVASKDILLHLDRARGPFLNAAFTGLALCIGLAAGLVLLPLTRLPWRLAHLGLLALFVPAIYYTRTRSVYLAFVAIGLGVVLAMRTSYPRWKVYALPLCLVGLLLGLNAGRLASEERTSGGLAQMREVAIRFELADKSLAIIREHPFFGLGLAQFRSTAVTAVDETEYQHNHLIGLAAELGLVGLAIYLGILWQIFRRLFALFPALPEQRFYNANFLFLVGLALLANLISNTFVEPSLHAFANINFFLFAGLVDRLYNRHVLSRP